MSLVLSSCIECVALNTCILSFVRFLIRKESMFVVEFEISYKKSGCDRRKISEFVLNN